MPADQPRTPQRTARPTRPGGRRNRTELAPRSGERNRPRRSQLGPGPNENCADHTNSRDAAQRGRTEPGALRKGVSDSLHPKGAISRPKKLHPSAVGHYRSEQAPLAPDGIAVGPIEQRPCLPFARQAPWS